MAKHHEIALEIVRQGIVLLRNDGALPLLADRALKIAVEGEQARSPRPAMPPRPARRHGRTSPAACFGGD
jgi:beta-glucosidase-like glycosyl hydrolase